MSAPSLVLVTTDLGDPREHAQLADTAQALGAHLAGVQGPGAALTEVLSAVMGRTPAPATVRLAVVPGLQPGTGASWVRRVAGHWLRSAARSGPDGIRLELVPGVAPSADLSAVTDHLAGTAAAITGQEAELHCPAWAEVPDHQHHLLVCRGPRCSAQGAPEAARAISAELRQRGWGDDVVLVTQTGCLFPCNRAPVVCSHPGGRWDGPVHPEGVAAYLDRIAGLSGP